MYDRSKQSIGKYISQNLSLGPLFAGDESRESSPALSFEK